MKWVLSFFALANVLLIFVRFDVMAALYPLKVYINSRGWDISFLIIWYDGNVSLGNNYSNFTSDFSIQAFKWETIVSSLLFNTNKTIGISRELFIHIPGLLLMSLSVICFIGLHRGKKST